LPHVIWISASTQGAERRRPAALAAAVASTAAAAAAAVVAVGSVAFAYLLPLAPTCFRRPASTLCGPVAVSSRVARKPPPSRAVGCLLARSRFARRQRQNGDCRHRCTYGGHVYITSVEVFSCTYFYRDSNHAVEMSVMHRGVHDYPRVLQQCPQGPRRGLRWHGYAAMAARGGCGGHA
jgi:hypothetical protein